MTVTIANKVGFIVQIFSPKKAKTKASWWDINTSPVKTLKRANSIKTEWEKTCPNVEYQIVERTIIDKVVEERCLQAKYDYPDYETWYLLGKDCSKCDVEYKYK